MLNKLHCAMEAWTQSSELTDASREVCDTDIDGWERGGRNYKGKCHTCLSRHGCSMWHAGWAVWHLHSCTDSHTYMSSQTWIIHWLYLRSPGSYNDVLLSQVTLIILLREGQNVAVRLKWIISDHYVCFLKMYTCTLLFPLLLRNQENECCFEMA